MTEVDDQIARAAEVIDRTRSNAYGAATKSRKRREGEVMHRIGRIAVADFAILITAVVVGFFIPLGMFGALAVMALLIATTVVLAMAPAAPEVRAEALPGAPLRVLPMQTEAWLDRQRASLPAPVHALVDSIGARLDALGPQVADLDENAPAASEVRKLIGEQLPELVRGYQRVPATLRAVPRNGRSPDDQLADGLRVIDGEIGEMSAGLAQGNLDQLATRERYLQIRYREDGTEG